jgi:hypothetical protein
MGAVNLIIKKPFSKQKSPRDRGDKSMIAGVTTITGNSGTLGIIFHSESLVANNTLLCFGK